MDTSSEDKAVVDLLSKLRDLNGTYPPKMLSSRREAYLQQMTSLGLGIGAGSALKNAAKGGNGAGVATTATSKILEMALVVAIVVEAGTIIFLYRNKIADAIRNYVNSPTVHEVTSVPELSHPSNPNLLPDTATIPVSDTPTVTVTVTPSITPSPQFTVESAQKSNTNGASGADNSVNTTPNPAGVNSNNNNGNQYGLTPKPVRTKENNGNNLNSNGGNNGNNSSNSNAGGGNNGNSDSNIGNGNNK